MARVAVGRHPRITGYDGKVDWAAVKPAFVVSELETALAYDYPCDAHLVTYVFPNCNRQPRIRKCGLPYLETLPMVDVLFCDVDNAGHASWTDELVAEALQRYATLDVLQTAGVYHTAHGARIVQPIVEPIPVDRAELYIASWLSKLANAGVDVDWTCKDWTRLFRMPNVKRDGVFRKAPFIDLSRMRPVEVEPLSEQELEELKLHIRELRAKARPAHERPVRAPRIPARARMASGDSPCESMDPIAWQRDLSAEWQSCVPEISNAIREEADDWHELFLALSGAFLSRGVEPGELPALVRAISLATNADSRTEDRVTSARTTVDNDRRGNPISGFGALRSRWPGVADALDRVIPSTLECDELIEAKPNELAVAKPNPLATVSDIEAALHNAPDGLTLIGAESGYGKTIAAICVAVERANKPYATADAEGLRAPTDSKTAISVERNSLALELAADLRKEGVDVKRVFGRLSLLEDDGQPVCKMHEVAKPLVAGGQAMHWELCLGRNIDACEHSAGCRAKNGYEGPDNARVIVGTHQLIGALDGEAGTSGLLIFDGPPDLLEAVKMTSAQMKIANDMRNAFDSTYVSAVAPAFQALRAFLEQATPEESMRLTEAIARGEGSVDSETIKTARNATGCTGDLVALALEAQLDEHNNKAPPIRWCDLCQAKESPSLLKRLGTASRVLGGVYKALSAEAPAVVRVSLEDEQRVATLVFPREQTAKALRRQGAVVVMDATARVDDELYAKVVGYDPRVHHFPARDGAPIERIQVHTSGASRKLWLPGGKLSLDDSNLVTSLRTALDLAWPVRRVGIITMLPVELALRLALEPENAGVLGEWIDAGQPAKLCPQIVEKLGGAIKSFDGEIVLEHYGAVRGLNNMKDVDCLITLGDPWPNVEAVRNEAAFLELDETWEARVEARCQAELEQAHGRLRPVHRDWPGKAIHVGMMKPGGTGWQEGEVQVMELPRGPHKAEAAMTKEDFKAIVNNIGGVRAAARKLSCSPMAISRYIAGERAVTGNVAMLIAELVS